MANLTLVSLLLVSFALSGVLGASFSFTKSSSGGSSKQQEKDMSKMSPEEKEKEAQKMIDQRTSEVVAQTLADPNLSKEYKNCVLKKFQTDRTGFVHQLNKFVNTGVQGIGYTLENLGHGIADSLQGIKRGGLFGKKGLVPSLADNIEFVLEGELEDCNRKYPNPKNNQKDSKKKE